MACFASSASPAPSAACPAGQQRSARLQDVDDYFRDIGASLPALSDSMLYGFCMQGFACLPCRPGQYELDGQCVACDVGSYQPYFEATRCFACSAGQTTARAGSNSIDACVCMSAFELLGGMVLGGA